MHAAFEGDPIRMIVEMDEGRGNRLSLQRSFEKQGCHMMKIARAHEAELRILAERRGALGDITGELGKSILPTPEPDRLAGSLVEILMRARKLAGAHEIGLQLQRIIEMKKKELHRLISGLRASEAGRVGQAPDRSPHA